MEKIQCQERALLYAQQHHTTIDLESPLGTGTDGYVWPSGRKTAVKALNRSSCYQVERESYQRLKAESITEVDMFAIPSLVDFDDELLVIEMTIVSPPFILDFGKVDLDDRTEFPAEVWADQEKAHQEYFGDRWDAVRSAFFKLEKLGIYHLDIRPGNVMFGDE